MREHWASEQGPIYWQPTGPFAFFVRIVVLLFVHPPDSESTANMETTRATKTRHKTEKNSKRLTVKLDCDYRSGGAGGSRGGGFGCSECMAWGPRLPLLAVSTSPAVRRQHRCGHAHSAASAQVMPHPSGCLVTCLS